MPISGWLCWNPCWAEAVWMLSGDTHLNDAGWKTVWGTFQKLLVLHSPAFTAVSNMFSPGRDAAAFYIFIFSFEAHGMVRQQHRRRRPPPSHEWSFQNCFLYLGNGPIAMPWMLLLIYRGHSMKQPSGNVLIINLFHTLIKDSWQPLVFAAAVQQESDAGELHLREKQAPRHII